MINQPALWHCEKCGRDFANRNQLHACGRYDLEHHFKGKRPEIRALFDAVAAAVRALGPVRVLPEKTRIAFQVRMSFAQVTPRTNWLDAFGPAYFPDPDGHLLEFIALLDGPA